MRKKEQFVSDLREGMEVDDIFSVGFKKYPKAYRNGFSFELRLQDSSGQINAVYWGGLANSEAAVQELYDSFKERDIVRVRGKVSVFRDALQISINPEVGHLLEKTTDFDLCDFVPSSERDLDEMMDEIDAAVMGISNRDLRAVLQSFFTEPEFRSRFKNAPAAITHHCNWIGGLAEHTLNIYTACEFMTRQYEELDRDLLLTGALLHDIGKVREYEVTSNIDCSLEGRLIGHVVVGAQMVDDACRSVPAFPELLRLKLVHMILSSHGKLEYGSPKLPAFPEAMALALVDQMGATMEKLVAIKKECASRTEDEWAWDKEYGGVFLR
jgi:3'-5' exoribonuclease